MCPYDSWQEALAALVEQNPRVSEELREISHRASATGSTPQKKTDRGTICGAAGGSSTPTCGSVMTIVS